MKGDGTIDENGSSKERKTMNAQLHLDRTICPVCEARLSRSEIVDGWCEACGKKLPAYITGRITLAPGLEVVYQAPAADFASEGPGPMSA